MRGEEDDKNEGNEIETEIEEGKKKRQRRNRKTKATRGKSKKSGQDQILEKSENRKERQLYGLVPKYGWRRPDYEGRVVEQQHL